MYQSASETLENGYSWAGNCVKSGPSQIRIVRLEKSMIPKQGDIERVIGVRAADEHPDTD
jgi:hypothetical protein